MKEKNKTRYAIIIIIVAVFIYLLPLWLNINKAFTTTQRNCISDWYSIYRSSAYAYFSLLRFNFPFWACYLEGGAFLQAYPDELSTNPFFIFSLLFGVVKGLNISYCLLYVMGALSMFYLTRNVLNFDYPGAIYSSLVFSMCGFFPIMQVNGFIMEQGTILLPLLIAFFLKALYSNRYIFPAALILTFFFIKTGIYFIVVCLFLLLFSLVGMVEQGFSYKKKFKKRYLIVFIAIFFLSLLYAMPKFLSFLEVVKFKGISDKNLYYQTMNHANNFGLLENILYSNKRSSMGAMYMGILPPFLCLSSAILFFRKLRTWIVLLVIFVLLYCGPKALLDLQYILYNLPIFNSMREITKYYALILVFLISLMSGYFFYVFKGKHIIKKRILIGAAIILITYVDLFIANTPYFNEFNTTLPLKKQPNEFFQVKLVNTHRGDEGEMQALAFSLFLKNIGIINYVYHRPIQLINDSISAKYFIIPRYAFLMPDTRLLTIKNPDYSGEVYFLSTLNKAVLKEINPQQIKIQVDVKEKDKLIINQNYSKWWRSRQVQNYHKLLSIWLEKPGNYEVKLDFIPFPFYVGLMISLVSLIISIYMFFRIKPAKNHMN